VLAYRSGSGGNLQVNAYTRDGKPDGTVLQHGQYGSIALSPDGKLLVVTLGTSDDRDLWLKDLSSGVFSRFTSSPGVESSVVWSPDSRRVAYVGNTADKVTLFETVVGSGVHTPIPGDANFLEDWVDNGKYFLARRDRAVFLLPAPKNGQTQNSNSASPADSLKPIFNESYSTDLFNVSPDGRWVAYTSLESGRAQIMVADFPSFTRRRQISVAGGTQPLWRSDSRELFFLSADRKLIAVELKPDSILQTGPLRTLFQTNVLASSQVGYLYAATPDGKRFLMREAVASNNGAIEPLYVMTNWLSLVSGAPRP
jgi:eukaryotic-like serine/threonine-protein kinase